VASQGLGVEEGAELLASYYRELGCQEVEFIPSESYPGLFAYYDAGAPKTLVSYAMWDTKPASEKTWGFDPFAAEIVQEEPYGTVIKAPGAKGRKAPYVQFLNALEALKAVNGELPVNIIFLAEGEENQGSPTYRGFVDKYRDRLAAGQACHCPGAVQTADGAVEIKLGFKGLLYVELKSSGTASGKGPQGASSHGMAQVIVDSPVWRLVSALNTLTTDDGRTITIDGFYDDYKAPTEAERQEVLDLLKEYGEANWKSFLPGVRNAKTSYDDLDNEAAMLRFFYEPSCNINGLSAGYVGPGSPVFTLPHTASAMLDIRTPRGMSSAKSAERLRAHLDARGYSDIEVNVIAAHEPMRTTVDRPFVKVVIDLLKERGLSVGLMPTTGGGGPWSLMSAYFGMPVLFDVGLGFGGNAGTPGEFLALDDRGPLAGNETAEYFYCEMLERWANTPE
jgi:acetylornithine deacetylase/succinyl-diaminopimelate desuccinylase-like protein